MKTSLYTENKCKIVKLRGATIPVTWDTRVDMVAIFELLATLQVSNLNYNTMDTFIL